MCIFFSFLHQHQVISSNCVSVYINVKTGLDLIGNGPFYFRGYGCFYKQGQSQTPPVSVYTSILLSAHVCLHHMYNFLSLSAGGAAIGFLNGRLKSNFSFSLLSCSRQSWMTS